MRGRGGSAIAPDVPMMESRARSQSAYVANMVSSWRMQNSARESPGERWISAAHPLLGPRRGGRASVIPARGVAADLAASEQVVINGGDAPQLETYAAPKLDAWDRWSTTGVGVPPETRSSLGAVAKAPGDAGIPSTYVGLSYGEWSGKMFSRARIVEFAVVQPWASAPEARA